MESLWSGTPEQLLLASRIAQHSYNANNQRWSSCCGWNDSWYQQVGVNMGLASAFDCARDLLISLRLDPSLHVSGTCQVRLTISPESPRWRLAGQGMSHEAHLVVAQTNARGDMDAPLVLNEIKEILDTIEYEKNAGQTMSPLQLFKTATNRRRLFLAATPAVFANIVGNNIATYYLGAELATAGITEPIAQLQAVSTLPV